MNTAGKLGGECRIDHAVPLQPALPAERFRHDIKAVVSLAARARSGMTGVMVRLILDPQTLGCESLLQFFGNAVLGSHHRQDKGLRSVKVNGCAEGFCALSSLEGDTAAPA
jgi:hypothetical protein